MPERFVTAPLVVATFLDYLCPASRAAHRDTEPVFRKLQQQFGDDIAFVTVDFPLERECNPGDEVPSALHPESCEAAAMVRLAKERSTAGPLVEWLWSNQRGLGRDAIFEAAERLASRDARVAYPRIVAAVAEDAALGYRLGVRATPSYWINGVVTPRRSASDLRALVLHEAQRLSGLGAQSPSVPDAAR